MEKRNTHELNIIKLSKNNEKYGVLLIENYKLSEIILCTPKVIICR